MRLIIFRFDGWLSKWNGITPLQQAAECFLRVQITRASHPVELNNISLKEGDPILALHLWNERIPNLPPGGPDMAWARRAQRILLRSLQEVAREMKNDPRWSNVRAVQGESMLISLNGGEHLMRRLGFVTMPSHNRLGRFGELWENFYAWSLMWAYNPRSLHGRHLFSLKREEIWMAADEFIRRFGTGFENYRHVEGEMTAA